ncbi:N-acetylmuramoyl-L-alanine amidase [Sandaracinobacteroides hominis]|uniref:N-acetylmuramoyl-L-alanine amidase n=1 Tax=Sandaracinobacteroides hominis TaxID=2780086 RepID=UPI0018F620BF|nr:N-acetylmuramoyl-L-alanine amidase [Sandaracinobacteroides hominis]
MPFRRLLLVLLLVLSQPAFATAVVGAMRVISTAEGVTVRVALSEPLPVVPKAFALNDPMRWAIDMRGASSMRWEAPGGGEAKNARISQFDPETVRLVVEFNQPMQLAEVFQDRGQALELRFRPTDAAGFRQQVSRGRSDIAGFRQEVPRAVPPGPKPPVDLAADSAARLDAVESALAEAQRELQPPAPAAKPQLPAAQEPVVQPQQPIDTRVKPKPPAVPAVATPAPPPLPQPVATARKPRRGKFIVAIDPGHGGKDPGAPSALGGPTEKDAVLAIAKRAKSAIEKEARRKGIPIEVRLTRDNDIFIPLGGRVRLARQWSADLFISIHADSAPNVLARGASVYTLSEVASDREAARVATKENRADLIAGIDLSGEDREVASILVDIGNRDAMNASVDFAQELQKGMEPEGVTFRTQFHRFANFQVLRNLGVPAVLLETGFLSNEEDARYLFSSKGQQAIADGIGEAVVQYAGGR